MRYLLDTCIISELIAKQPNQQVVAWIDSIDEEDLFLSVITLGEINRGVARLPDSKRKQQLSNWLKTELLQRFQGRIAIIDTSVMLVWGELMARLEANGRKLPAIDSIIAAIALHGGFTLVTRNERDFVGTGIRIINPFELD